MISIMEHAHQYVPATTKDVDIEFPTLNEKLSINVTEYHRLLFGGDQLTAKRGRGSQRIRCNSITPSEQISGLVPTSDDWHTKVVFLMVIDINNYYSQLPITTAVAYNNFHLHKGDNIIPLYIILL